MRRSVTISTSLIAALALLLAGLLGTTAEAQTADGKPMRNLHDAIVKKHGKLFFKGRVDPGHGPVVVQKKECAKPHCTWHRFKQVRSHGPREKWSVRVFAPRRGNWYWRAYVKPYGGYAKSWSHVWKTYTTRV
jgi:hypothetical protein